jgi:hypothetical protein
MKELEEHLRAVTEQVKIPRKLLKDFTENKNSVKYLLKKLFPLNHNLFPRHFIMN